MDSRYQRDHSGFIVFRRAGILHVISGVSEIMMPEVQYFVQVQGEAVGKAQSRGGQLLRLCYLARPRARARIAHPSGISSLHSSTYFGAGWTGPRDLCGSEQNKKQIDVVQASRQLWLKLGRKNRSDQTHSSPATDHAVATQAHQYPSHLAPVDLE